jgi:hypothetical protein
MSIHLLLAAGFLTAGQLFAADPADSTAAPPLRKVAIIVENRAGAQLNDKVSVLEDLLSSRIAGKGYSVISRDVTLNALKTYPSVGIAASSQKAVNANASRASDHSYTSAESAQADLTEAAAAHGKVEGASQPPRSASAELAGGGSAQIAATEAAVDKASGHASATLELARSDSAQVAATPETTKLDQALNDNTSALRLAQNLGADFILIPSITTYGTDKRTYNGNGISTINVIHTLRVSYKIVEAGEGGAIHGDTVIASKTIRQSPDLQVENSDVINELLDDAAGQLADAIVSSAASLPKVVAQASMVNFSIVCSMTDIKEQPIMVPNVQLTPDNRVVKTNASIEVQPLDVTVELDGVAIGSAPGTFQAFPGLHKLRLSREGFKDWERTVNVYAGQKLRVALQMSDAGFARWEQNMEFLQGLENGRKLTDAQVKVLEGKAKFLSESHYRVDTKENIKIYKSLF